MRHTIIALLSCAMFCAFATQTAFADTSITAFAQAHHLQVALLDPQAAVELAGRSTRIVLRPGDQIAEVNGKLETLASAPYVRRGAMFVSDADARRLGTFAGASALAVSGPLAQAPDVNARPGGAITLDVRPVAGSEALAVSGRAPAGQPVQITLFATFSREMPDVVLSRSSILPDGSGAFAATVPIAPGYFRGAVVTVVAATPSGSSASARYIVGVPNVTVPPDNLPHNVQ